MNTREYDDISYLKSQGKDIGCFSDSVKNLYHALFGALPKSSFTLVLERTWKLNCVDEVEVACYSSSLITLM